MIRGLPGKQQHQWGSTFNHCITRVVIVLGKDAVAKEVGVDWHHTMGNHRKRIKEVVEW